MGPPLPLGRREDSCLGCYMPWHDGPLICSSGFSGARTVTDTTEQRKRQKYFHLDASHHFTPIAVATLGAVGHEFGVGFFRNFAKRICSLHFGTAGSSVPPPEDCGCSQYVGDFAPEERLIFYYCVLCNFALGFTVALCYFFLSSVYVRLCICNITLVGIINYLYPVIIIFSFLIVIHNNHSLHVPKKHCTEVIMPKLISVQAIAFATTTVT